MRAKVLSRRGVVSSATIPFVHHVWCARGKLVPMVLPLSSLELFALLTCHSRSLSWTNDHT